MTIAVSTIPYNLTAENAADLVWTMLTNPRFMADIGHMVDPELLPAGADTLKIAARSALAVYRESQSVSHASTLQHATNLCESGKLTYESRDGVAAWIEARKLAGPVDVAALSAVIAPLLADKLAHAALMSTLDRVGKKQSTADARAMLERVDALREGKSARAGLAFRPLTLAEAEHDPISWIWRGRIARGQVHLLQGAGGVGKSSALRDIMARLASARALPGEETQAEDSGEAEPAREPMTCLLIGAEDHSTVVAARLRDAGLDADTLARVHVADATLSLPADLATLEKAITDTGAGLVVIERLHIRGSQDKAEDVRGAIDPLAELARRTGAAIVIIRHLNKKAANARLSGAGSHAWRDTARLVMVLAPSPDDPDSRVLAVEKTNLGSKPAAIAVREVADFTGARAAQRLQWHKLAEDITADDLVLAEHAKAQAAISGKRSRAETRDAFETAVRAFLSTGPKGKEEIAAMLAPLGLGNAYKLDRLLPTIASKGRAKDGRWIWTLSDAPIGMDVDNAA